MQTFYTFLGLALKFIQLGEEYKCTMNQSSWEIILSLWSKMSWIFYRTLCPPASSPHTLVCSISASSLTSLRLFSPFVVSSPFISSVRCITPQYCRDNSVQFSSAAQSCSTLCDPANRSTPGLPVHHQLQESTQTHVH